MGANEKGLKMADPAIALPPELADPLVDGDGSSDRVEAAGPGELSDSTLSRYFQEIAAHRVFDSEQEIAVAREFERREVDLWRVGFEGRCFAQEHGVPIYLQLGPEWTYTASHQGFGFPVFMDDTFWGLEYPAGYSHYENGLMTLRHFPGRTESPISLSARPPSSAWPSRARLPPGFGAIWTP